MEYNTDLMDFDFQQLKNELHSKIHENRTMDLKFADIVKQLEKVIGHKDTIVAS